MYGKFLYSSLYPKPYPTTNLSGIVNPTYFANIFFFILEGLLSKTHILILDGSLVLIKLTRKSKVAPESSISSTNSTSFPLTESVKSFNNLISPLYLVPFNP